MGEAEALRAGLRTAFDALLAVLLAPACAACEQPLDEPTRGPVCGSCWAAVRPLVDPLCDACGDPLSAWRSLDSQLTRCTRCRRMARHVRRARAIGLYDGTLRTIVHAFKYDGRRSLAARLARLMRERGAAVLDGADAVVPVPLHAARRRERGFNQAADLARHLDLPVIHALRRTRATASQASLPAARRHKNVRGAFAATGRARLLRGCTAVLVDDVSTTGATLDACARALLEAGVFEVRALTAARVASAPR